MDRVETESKTFAKGMQRFLEPVKVIILKRRGCLQKEGNLSIR
jgi:hypothetical protein